jgi:hypothetical protein
VGWEGSVRSYIWVIWERKIDWARLGGTRGMGSKACWYKEREGRLKDNMEKKSVFGD